MSRVPRTVSEYLSKIGARGGRIGGKATSEAKAKAVRANGKLGGRPPGKKSETTREESTGTKGGRTEGRH